MPLAAVARGVGVQEAIVSEDQAGADLNGVRVLIVEDEAAIAMLLEDMLLDFGCEVVGPVARVAAALEAVKDESFGVAILDVNLAGEPIFAVAEALARRGLPFVFSTGYGASGIQDPFRDRPVIQKPFTQHELQQSLLVAMRNGAGA